ncbi:MAG: hypothetical protein HYZ31_13630 [Gammaproteobacteria bacterium]|nr:hypothetical protein [Gammaproteobacteria bacterium]
MIMKNFALPLLLSLLALSSANAAPLDIDSMFVNNAAATLDINGSAFPPPVTVSSTLPSVEITMGAYQPNIFSMGSTSTIYLNIYSTSAYGMAAPSGFVDGNTISVDFSSLRVTGSYSTYSFDVALWPLTTTLDYGSYDPITGDYIIGWSENFIIDVSSFFSVPANLDVSLSGYLTTVPVPAAFWLFGSGLIALFGFANSKKKH